MQALSRVLAGTCRRFLRYHHECKKGAERHAAVLWAPPQQTGKPITEQGLDAAPNVPLLLANFRCSAEPPEEASTGKPKTRAGIPVRGRSVVRFWSARPCSAAAAIVLSTVPAVPV